MTKGLEVKCHAKINLFLKLVGKRSDHYHELESLFAFLDLSDELSVERYDKFKLKIDGEFAAFVDHKNNLLTKILDFFSVEFGKKNPDIKNLNIKLTKNIPVGAGLGGGSSNAACFMKLLNHIFSLNLAKEDLQEISLNFGSDIPFFFEDQASIIKGRGEIIRTYPKFFPIHILLINPRIHLPTKEVFLNFDGNFSSQIPTEELLKIDVLDLIKNFPNDLTESAISIASDIKVILEELKNYSEIIKMSGSGASCFAVLNSESEAELAVHKITKKFPNFFIKKAKVLSCA